MKNLIKRLRARGRRPHKASDSPVVISKCPNHSTWIGPADHPDWLVMSLPSTFLSPTQVSILDIPDEMFLQLEAMRKDTGLRCICEVFNWALSLHKWAQEQIAAGSTVASIDHRSASYKELVMPWMRAVRESQK